MEIAQEGAPGGEGHGGGILLPPSRPSHPPPAFLLAPSPPRGVPVLSIPCQRCCSHSLLLLPLSFSLRFLGSILGLLLLFLDSQILTTMELAAQLVTKSNPKSHKTPTSPGASHASFIWAETSSLPSRRHCHLLHSFRQPTAPSQGPLFLRDAQLCAPMAASP